MLPECGIPVCIVNCKFASVQQLRVEFAKSRGDAPVLVYGRLVYKSAAMGLKRASVLVPAKASAEWDAPELSSCSSPAIGKDKLLKPVLWSSLTVTGFVQLAAETAGADSEIGNELLIAATRKTGPRQVIRLCSSLQSLGEFEREHAVNFNLSPSSQTLFVVNLIINSRFWRMKFLLKLRRCALVSHSFFLHIFHLCSSELKENITLLKKKWHSKPVRSSYEKGYYSNI